MGQNRLSVRACSHNFFVMNGTDEILTCVGILWDVDGTICDAMKLAFTCTNSVLKKHGYDDITMEQFKFGCRFPTPQRMYWHATGNEMADIFHSDLIRNAIEHSSVLELASTLGNEFDNLYVDLVDEEACVLYEGMRDLLKDFSLLKAITAKNTTEQCPRLKMGLLSNACGKYVSNVCRALSIEKYFDVALGADNVPAAKPSSAGLLQICSVLNLLPSNCMYIGDSPTDGLAARNAGMNSIGVGWGANAKSELIESFDIVVDTVEELKNLLISVLHKYNDEEYENTEMSSMMTGRQNDNTQMNTVFTTFAPAATSIKKSESKSCKNGSQIRVKWETNVVDNEHLNRYRTDDETWSGDRHIMPRPKSTLNEKI